MFVKEPTVADELALFGRVVKVKLLERQGVRVGSTNFKRLAGCTRKEAARRIADLFLPEKGTSDDC